VNGKLVEPAEHSQNDKGDQAPGGPGSIEACPAPRPGFWQALLVRQSELKVH